MLVMVATIPLGIWITHTPSAELGNDRLRCQTGTAAHALHSLTIRNNTIVPARIMAQKCDTLTIINLDNQAHQITLGTPTSPISYDGVPERLLARNQTLSVVLIRTGTFFFYDRTDTRIHGAFTVT